MYSLYIVGYKCLDIFTGFLVGDKVGYLVSHGIYGGPKREKGRR